MSEPSYSIAWNRRLVSADESETITKGQAVILNEDRDGWLPATLANRTATGRRANGVALSDADATNRGFDVQVTGAVGEDIVDLGDGASGAVRVGDNGFLERAETPAEDDDIVGRCDADGTVYLAPQSIATGTGDVTNGSNVGTGAEIFKDKSGSNLRLRTLKVDGLKSIEEGSNEISIRPCPPNWVNVRDYGAVGDGVTDDLPAFEAALAAFDATTSGTLYVPPGDYYWNGTLQLNRRVHLRGSGPLGGYDNTTRIFVASGNVGIFVRYETDDGGSAQYGRISDIKLQSSVAALPVWQPATSYSAGDRVRAADDNRWHFVAQNSGTSGPSTPFVDGNAVAGADNAGYTLDGATLTDNGIEWLPATYCGVLVEVACNLEDLLVAGFTNAGVHLQAGLGQQPESHGTTVCNLSVIKQVISTGNGVGFLAKGGDANVCLFLQCDASASGNGQSGTGGHAYFDTSFLGNKYLNCHAAAATGRAFIIRGVAANGANLDNCYSEADCRPSLLAERVTAIGGQHGAGFDSSSSGLLLMAAPFYCSGLVTLDPASPKELRAYVDVRDGASVFGMRTTDDGGSNMIRWSADPPGWPDGYWARMYGPSNSQFFGGLTSAKAPEGPGWVVHPYGEMHGYPGSDDLVFRGSDSALRVLPLRGGERLSGDTFVRQIPVADEWLERVIVEEGYRGSPWVANTIYSNGTASIGEFPSVVEPTTNGVWPAAGLQVWVCTTSGTSHLTTEPVWPGSPTPGVTTIADGSVVWTYLGQTPDWLTTKYLTDGGGPP